MGTPNRLTSSLAVLAGLLVLLVLARPASPLQRGPSATIPEATIPEDCRRLLLEGLEAHAAWLQDERLYGQRKELMRVVLEVDPDHADAHRALGHKRLGDEWVEPDRDRRVRDRAELASEVVAAHYLDAVRPFSEEMLARADDGSRSAAERLALENAVLRFDPDHEELRTRRGEVRVAGEWLLAETVAGRVRRVGLAEALATEGAGDLVPVERGADEPDFGLALHGLGNDELRVFATSGTEEAAELGRALLGARTAFRRLFSAEVELPPNCTVYLLAGPEERDRFLAAHPGVSEEERVRLAGLLGSGIPGTSDWAHWGADPSQRRDTIVRMALGWFLGAAFGTQFDHAWVYEGVGAYLGEALIGTHLTWFMPAIDEGDPRGAELRPRLFQLEADWMAEVRALAEGAPLPLASALGRDRSGMTTSELLASYALAAYLIEGRPEEAEEILGRIGEGEASGEVLQDALGRDLDRLALRLARWVRERGGAETILTAEHTPEQAGAAWRALDLEAKRACIASYRAKLEEVDSPQLARIRALLEGATVDRDDPPEPSPPTTYDPKRHAPSQPIRRRWLDLDDERVTTLAAEVLVPPSPQAPRGSWRYEWATGRVVHGEPPAPEGGRRRRGRAREATAEAGSEEAVLDREFENALDGYAPEIDLALAILVGELDRGEERAACAAFAHNYTDRDGGAYPGITLYDMWKSGTVMEMPDVDTLGIIHDVLDDWTSWTAPVSGEDHPRLYGRIAELLADARHYRELRETVALCYLVGSPPVADGYESTVTNYHALWAHHDDDPGALASALPDAAGWEDFIRDWVARCKSDEGVYPPGIERRDELEEAADTVRTALVAALEANGVFR